MKRLLHAAGAAATAAALCLTFAAAADATGHRADTPTKRAGEVINCATLGAEGSSVLGNQCDTTRWGPISDFVITDGKNAYFCQNGWAEGGLWVSGQDCRQA